MIAGGEADLLKLYVQNGGTLVSTFNTGLVDEHHNPTNGDGLQETTGTGPGGLLVWRKADNWTAYTDGYRTSASMPINLAMILGLSARVRYPRGSVFHVTSPVHFLLAGPVVLA